MINNIILEQRLFGAMNTKKLKKFTVKLLVMDSHGVLHGPELP
jgi:hypothetical protein